MTDLAPTRRWLPKLQKTLAWLFLGFMGLFLGRLLYSFVAGVEPPTQTLAPKRAVSSALFDEDMLFKGYRQDYRNNAQRLRFNAEAAAPATAQPVDGVAIASQLTAAQIEALEVYTREARIGSQTGEYEEDVAKALAATRRHKAEVRLEKTAGVKPNRSFNIVLRVPVDEFDACVDALSEIGDVQTSSFNKEDKSDEVRQRFAERDALKAYAESLAKLRSTEGKVGELINLETQIQSVERQIQALNASLGGFVQKESYNNINFSLQERIEVFVDEEKYPLAARVVAAFVWTVNAYAAGVSVLAVVALTIGSVRVVRRG